MPAVATLSAMFAGCGQGDAPATPEDTEHMPPSAVAYTVKIRPVEIELAEIRPLLSGGPAHEAKAADERKDTGASGPEGQAGARTWRIEFGFGRPVTALTHALIGPIYRDGSDPSLIKIADAGMIASLRLTANTTSLVHLWGVGDGGGSSRPDAGAAVFAPELFTLTHIDDGPASPVPPSGNAVIRLSSGHIWVGPRARKRIFGLDIVTGPAVPEWLTRRWYQLARTTLPALDRRHRLRLPEAAVLMALFQAGKADEISLHGYTRNNAVLVHAKGQGLLTAGPASRRAADINFMHELMHLIQERETPSALMHSRVPPFVLEGSAEAMALYQLERDGFWTQAHRNAYLHGRKRECAAAMRGGPLAPQGVFPSGTALLANYACGLVMFNAIAVKGRLSPVALWYAFEADHAARAGMTDVSSMTAFVAKVTQDDAFARATRDFLIGDYTAGFPQSVIRQFEDGTL